eukprot:gene17557-20904_t
MLESLPRTIVSASDNASGADVTVLNAETGAEDLNASISNSTVRVVYLRVDITLPFALSKVKHNLTIIGQCAALCVLDGNFTRRIFEVAEAGSLVLSRLQLQNGYSNAGGGAVYTLGTLLSLVNCTFFNNVVEWAEGNAPEGGAVFAKGPKTFTVEIKDSSFTFNRGDNGGAVSMHVLNSESYGILVVERSDMRNNTNIWNGGVLYGYVQVGGGATWILEGNTFENNGYSGYGGVIYLKGYVNLFIHGCVFLTNAGYKGGAIYFDSVHQPNDEDLPHELTIEASLFTGNQAYVSGGAIFIQHDNFFEPLVKTFVDCKLEWNFAPAAGAIYMPTDHPVTFMSTVLSSNSATAGAGGAVFAKSGSGFEFLLQFYDSMLAYNSAVGNAGAIFLETSREVNQEGSKVILALSNTTLKRNTASGNGGALQLTNAKVIMRQSSCRDNAASVDGGCIFAFSAQITLEGTELSHNTAANSGGALKATSGCHITLLSGAAFHGNAAIFSYGGAISAFGNTQVVSPIGLLHLSGNEAGTYGGGVALFDNSVFHAANGSEFKANRAGTAGGHLHAAASSVVWMEQSVLDGGLITSGHGGALSIEESILELAHSRLMNSAAYHGGGILLRSRSNASLEYVLVRGNSALSRGGGLRVESGSAVRINHSEISFNHALDMGAGMEVAANAEGFVENSSFVGNEVEKGSGGGVSLASGMASITLLNVSFEEGSTPRGHGAGVYVAAPPAPAILETRLVALRFVNNSAVAGPNIYWEFVADRDEQAELDCQQCTVAPLQSELYASSAASFVLLQAGEVVLPEGLESISARPITPPIKYAGLDFYGNVAQEPGMDDVAVFSLDATLSGTLTVPYQQTGAEFNRLSVTGRPGASYTLVFQPWQDSWSSVTLKVALQPCQAGDVYIETAQTCSTCEAGSIKFDNSTDECTSCKNSGLTCHGGDAFTLEDGYFMAELSIHAACAERSAECVLARTSECDWSPACSSTANRNNMGGALAVPLEAQCGEGYQQGTTVLCGSCEAGYQLSMATGRCRECPTSVAERVGAASVVPLFVIMLAGVYLLVRQKAPAGIGSPPLDPSESEERDSVATAAMHAAGRRLDRAQNFGRILANNVQ